MPTQNPWVWVDMGMGMGMGTQCRALLYANNELPTNTRLNKSVTVITTVKFVTTKSKN
jgi:hypothetical protein